MKQYMIMSFALVWGISSGMHGADDGQPKGVGHTTTQLDKIAALLSTHISPDRRIAKISAAQCAVKKITFEKTTTPHSLLLLLALPNDNKELCVQYRLPTMTYQIIDKPCTP